MMALHVSACPMNTAGINVSLSVFEAFKFLFVASNFGQSLLSVCSYAAVCRES